jgi:hypothetical protein
VAFRVWTGDGFTEDLAGQGQLAPALAEDAALDDEMVAAFLDRVHAAMWWQVRLDLSNGYEPTRRWLTGPGFLRSGIVQTLVAVYQIDPDVVRDWIIRVSQPHTVARSDRGRFHRLTK